jgi:hypothetical protein
MKKGISVIWKSHMVHNHRAAARGGKSDIAVLVLSRFSVIKYILSHSR